MKAVQLTDDEIKAVIGHYSHRLYDDGAEDYNSRVDNIIERLRYLNKRLNDNKKNDKPTIPTAEPKKEW